MSLKNASFFISAQAGVCPLAIGMPGAAKTAVTQAFARGLGRRAYTLIGSIREPADVGGWPQPDKMVVNEQTFDVMKLIPPSWLLQMIMDERKSPPVKWVLLMDELTCCPPAVQAAMLRVINERVIGDTPVPDNVLMLACANPPGVAAAGVELEPPMANRLCHLKWHTDWDAWDRGMINGLRFESGTFPRLPAYWLEHDEESLDRKATDIATVGGMFTAFRKRQGHVFEDYPANDRTRAGAAWASMRSVTNAAVVLAAARSINADKEIEFELVEGCVGNAFANSYFEWERNLDLPDPADVLAWGVNRRNEALGKPTGLRKNQKNYWPINAKDGSKSEDYIAPGRPDQVLAMLTGLATELINKGEKTPERWEGAMEVIFSASQKHFDLAMACVYPIGRAINQFQQGGQRPHLRADISKELGPRLLTVLQNDKK